MSSMTNRTTAFPRSTHHRTYPGDHKADAIDPEPTCGAARAFSCIIGEGLATSYPLEDDVTMAPPQEDDLSAFETAKFGKNTKDRPVGERQRQTERLSVNCRDRMQQE